MDKAIEDVLGPDHDLEKLMAFAEAGLFPKAVLSSLLRIEKRRAFLDACAALEKEYTEQCTAANDPCLESGCALEGEICLQPLLNAGVEYQKACAAEWAKVFSAPENRVDAWKN